MKPIAYDKKLRTVTAPGGKAVKLSPAEMKMFDALIASHPRPVIFNALPTQRRHVFLFRLRAKLEVIGCRIAHSPSGYILRKI